MKRILRPALSAIILLAVMSAASQADWFGHMFDGGKKGGKLAGTQAAPETGEASGVDDRVWVVIKAAGKEARSRVADAGIAIEVVHGDTVEGTATQKAVHRLHDKGIVVIKQAPLSALSKNKNFPAPDDQYRNYGDVRTELQSIAKGHSKIASIVNLGKSLEGRDIIGIRFNASAREGERSDKPGILFLGTHHAREHLSTEVPLLLAKWLGDNSNTAEVKNLLRTRDIYIVPLVNPDGSEYDMAADASDGQPAANSARKWHRKNKTKNPDGSIGVDLNRNYGFHWGEGGASEDPSDETFRGPSAFSEPETQAVKRFVESHPNLKILLSYHTFSELILYPWGHTYDPIEDGPALKAYVAMAKQMAEWTGYTPEQSSGLYIASGDTTDWAWGAHKIFSFTIELTPRELNDGGFYPGNSAIQPTFEKNIKPALYLISLADDPYRAGK